MALISYKENLWTPRPYPKMDSQTYLQMLRSRKDELANGHLGIYLSRRIKHQGQDWYFPFIDIDAAWGEGEEEKIRSATGMLDLTYRIFNELGVADHFFWVATGNTGFHAFSNHLLSYDDYQAFVDFVKTDLSHIYDTKPTVELEMPHQLFVYKGLKEHNGKALVDHHSCCFDTEVLDLGCVNLNFYREITQGHPDPDQWIDFMKRFFDFKVVRDLSSLGKFGEKLHEYKTIDHSIRINRFDFKRMRSKHSSLSLSALQNMLKEKGIESNIQDRGGRMAISFQNLPCPICGNRNANARAYPPSYRLYCFNTHCAAHHGLPLSEWAQIDHEYETVDHSTKHPSLIPVKPTDYSNLTDIEDVLIQSLQSPESHHILITPGSGKTHVTLNHLVQNCQHKTVIYSCLNKDLKEEAYQKALKKSSDPSFLHLLHARDEVCQRKNELDEIVKKGYSPAETICFDCELRSSCSYYRERSNLQSGIYFVTHHMVPYLKDSIPNPDLIILDENLMDGFRLEVTCSESQFRTLYAVLEPKEMSLIDKIRDIIQSLATAFIQNQEKQPFLLNTKKLFNHSSAQHYLLGILAKQCNQSEYDIMDDIQKIVDRIDQWSVKVLHQTGVNRNAITWLKGFFEPFYCSYVLIRKDGQIELKVKYIASFPYREPPIKVLDATGHPRIIQALLKRECQEVKADILWNADITHIKANTSRSALGKIDKKKLEEWVKEALSKMTGEKILVVSYKKNMEQIIKLCQKLEPQKTFHMHHFHGPRGINTFENCDGVLVIGLPYQNPTGIGQDAYILFPEIRKFEEDLEREQSEIPKDENPEVDPDFDYEGKNPSDIDLEDFDSPDIDMVDWNNFHERYSDFSTSNEYLLKEESNVLTQADDLPAIHPDCIFDELKSESLEDDSRPTEEEKEHLRDSFLEASMLWELTQVVHRIRPVRKEKVDIVFISSQYPNHFPKPQETIDLSYRKDIVQQAIRILEPWINEFGFFNQDIGFLANIYVKSKEKKANVFRKPFADLVTDLQNKFSGQSCLRKSQKLKEKIKREIHLKNIRFLIENIRSIRLILLIYILYKKDYPSESLSCILNEFSKSNNFLHVIRSEYQKKNINLEKETSTMNNPLVLSKTNQISAIRINLLKNYPHFGRFKIKLPHAGNQWIEGIGIKEKVIQFYTNMMELGFIPKMDLNRNLIFDEPTYSIPTLPSRTVVVYFPYKENESILLGMDNQFYPWSHDSCQALMDRIQQNSVNSKSMRIITNDGKRMIHWLLQSNISQVHVIDLLLNEKIIRNTGNKDVMEKRTLSSLFHQYQIELNINDPMMFSQFYRLRRKQRKEIIKGKLKSIVRLENRILWIVTRMEKRGIQLDEVKFLELEERSKNSSTLHRDINTCYNLVKNDERLHDTINSITVTGRFACSLHTLSKSSGIRNCIIADEDHLFIKADYSSFEPRIIMGMSKDPKGIQLIKEGKNIYEELARNYVQKDDINEIQRYRKIFKSIILVMNNGGSEYAVYEDLKKDHPSLRYEQVREWIDFYYSTFPKVNEWSNRMRSKAKYNGVVKSRMGRRRWISVNDKDSSIINFAIQGTASDGFKIALVVMDPKLRALNAHIAHTLHDEVIVEVPIEKVEEGKTIVQESMEQAFERMFPGIPFPVEIKVSNNGVCSAKCVNGSFV